MTRLATSIALASIASILGRVVAVGSNLLSISLVLPYLGVEKYGVLLTLTSMVGVSLLFDLGVGNALTNYIAGEWSNSDRCRLRAKVEDALALALVVTAWTFGSIAVLGVGVYGYYRGEIFTVLGGSELSGVLVALCIGLPIHVLSHLVQRIQAGLQRIHYANIAGLAGQVLGVAALMVAVLIEGGTSFLLVCALIPSCGSAILGLYDLHRAGYSLPSRIIERGRKLAKNILRNATEFFVLQLTATLASGLDYLLIADRKGSAEVAEYGVSMRIYQFASQPLAILNNTLWGAYASAHSRRDGRDLSRLGVIFIGGTVFVGGVVSLFIYMNAVPLIDFLTKQTISPSTQLLQVIAVWVALEAGGTALSIFLMATERARPQIYAAILFACSSLVVKWWGFKYLQLSETLWLVIGAYVLSISIGIGIPLARSVCRSRA